MATQLNLEFVRKQFPALENEWILFDNAGGSQTLKKVTDKISEYLLTSDVQIGASYYHSRLMSERVSKATQEMATFVNAADISEIIMGSSTTFLLQTLANNFVQLLEKGDEIIVTNCDHEANIGCWRSLEKNGIVIKTWNLNQEDFLLHTEDLDKLMTEKTRLVAFTATSNILGTITPLKEFTKFIHNRGALVCVDAVAFAPHQIIDVQETDIDFYAFSFYKTYGPHYALLYGKKEELLKMPGNNHFFIDKSDLPLKFQPGNVNFELCWGLTGLTEYLTELTDFHYKDVKEKNLRTKMEMAYELFPEPEEKLSERLLAYLNSKKDIKIIGSTDSSREIRVPTISFVHGNTDSEAIVSKVDNYKIGIRYGHFYAHHLIDDLGLMQQNGVIRVSMVHYNTIEEVDQLIKAFDEII
ncbi:cysteine desulfurase-like protein [Bacteroidota bacterium]